MRQPWMAGIAGAVLIGSAVVGSMSCSRDVRKYATVVCEEMRDPEVSCIRGQRESDTLASGLVASQLAKCNIDIAMGALTGEDPPECETAAERHGLSVARFTKIDQEMRLRCTHGDAEACTIACCGDDRPVQSMPLLGIPGMP